MNSAKPTTWRAGDAPLLSNDPRSVRARKREHPVQVRFAGLDETIPTREGPVRARAGDAIVTGAAGEQWPVQPQSFAVRYRPLAPLAEGEPGTYVSLPIEVLALRMDAPFAVELPDGDLLHGQAGDWLVGYGDGGLAPVAATIFSMTYDPIT